MARGLVKEAEGLACSDEDNKRLKEIRDTLKEILEFVQEDNRDLKLHKIVPHLLTRTPS